MAQSKKTSSNGKKPATPAPLITEASKEESVAQAAADPAPVAKPTPESHPEKFDIFGNPL